MSGDFTEFSPWLVKDLCARGLWTEQVRNAIIAGHGECCTPVSSLRLLILPFGVAGSIQHIPRIPADLKDLYRTVWEIDPKDLLDMAADRGPYIDQSQSTVIHLEDPTSDQLVRTNQSCYTAEELTKLLNSSDSHTTPGRGA